MHGILDEQGRVEIPLELRSKLHLSAGARLEFQQSAKGFEVITKSEPPPATDGELVWKQGTLVYRHNDAAAGSDSPDIQDVIDQVRHERVEQILGFSFDREVDRP